MPSFADSIFLFVLALLLFGPKKLPVLARELGKWMGEFRRASNEFKMQMDEELRASEQADRQKQIAAMEAAAPVPPPLNDPPEPEHPHLRGHASTLAEEGDSIVPQPVSEATAPAASGTPGAPSSPTASSSAKVGPQDTPTHDDGSRLIPIATSGSLKMMPPATGLPTPRPNGLGSPNGSTPSNPLAGLVDALPEAPGAPSSPTVSPSATVGLTHAPETESVAHGN